MLLNFVSTDISNFLPETKVASIIMIFIANVVVSWRKTKDLTEVKLKESQKFNNFGFAPHIGNIHKKGFYCKCNSLEFL
jgi:hypothetical protein